MNLINFRSWSSGNVTLLRAQELWLNGFWELGALMSQLKADALSEENGEGYLGYIDTQHELIEDDLVQLVYQDWHKDKEYPSTGGGENFSTLANAQQVFTDYVSLFIQEKVAGVRSSIEDGSIPADSSWAIGAWFAESEIIELSSEIRTWARLWFPENLVEAACTNVLREIDRLVRAEVGQSYESGGQWDTYITQIREGSFDDLFTLGEEWMRNGQDGLGYGFEIIADVVERAESRAYDSGVLYRDLQITCSEARSFLADLDLMLPLVTFEEASRYSAVYLSIATYQNLICVPQDAPEDSDTEMFWPQVSISKDSSAIRAVRDAIEDRWDAKNWTWLYDLAAKVNRTDELEAMIETEKEAVSAQVDVLVDNVWNGPLSRDANGRIVPYSAIPVGDAMYVSWGLDLVDVSYNKIFSWVYNAEWSYEETEYVASAEYIAALLVVFENIWYNDAVRGLRSLSDLRVGASVVDKYWREFAADLAAMEGHRWGRIETFKKNAVELYENRVSVAMMTYTAMSNVSETELPERFEEIETIVGGRENMPPGDASSYLLELEDMRM